MLGMMVPAVMGDATPYTVYGYVKNYSGTLMNDINIVVKDMTKNFVIKTTTVQGEQKKGLFMANLGNYGHGWDRSDQISITADYWNNNFHYYGTVSFFIPSKGYAYEQNVTTDTAVFYPSNPDQNQTLPQAPPTNVPPQLKDMIISPATGLVTTTYYYNITYSDGNNEKPYLILVTIDGISHGMSYVSGSYTTGALFSYHIQLSEGDHTCWFYTTDGYANSSYSTQTMPGPHVLYQPMLSQWKFTPISGTPVTNFTYSVIYTDKEGIEPTQMTLIITSANHTKQYAMTKAQGNPQMGETFICTIGSHLLSPTTYQIVASDGNYQMQTMKFDGPLVVSEFHNNPLPELGDSGPFVAAFLAIAVLAVIILSVMYFNKRKSKKQERKKAIFNAKKEEAKKIIASRNGRGTNGQQPAPAESVEEAPQPPPQTNDEPNIVRRAR